MLLLLVVCALIPSAWLAWTWREMPQAGIYHDDGIYLVTGKAIASGHGYRIDSLPEQPFQTKYPPLYPLLLSIVWRLHPSFEGFLQWAALVSWLMLAGVVFVYRDLFGISGFSSRDTTILAIFLALSPVMVTLGLLTMSELPMMLLAGLALGAAERGRAATAGLLAGAAFLTRASALPLLLSLPAGFAWKRDFRAAATSFAAMLPAVIGWQVWVATHAAPGADPASLFYTSYLGLYLKDTPFDQVPDMAWANTASMIKGIGELVVFDEEVTIGTLTLARLLSVGVVIGAVRLVKTGRLVHYAAFSAFYMVTLLLWNYPPDSRFLLPVLPMVAAAVLTEMMHLVEVVKASFRKPKTEDKVAAVLVATLLGALGLYTAERIHFGLFRFIPKVFAQRAAETAQQADAHEWIRRNLPAEARVLSYSDPMLYLRTGRRGWSLRVPPSILKRADKGEIRRYFNVLPEFLRGRRLDFVLLTSNDYHMDVQSITLPAYRSALEDPGRFETLHRGPRTAVLRNRGAE